MRRCFAILLLVSWLIAPSGGVGLALHGMQHAHADAPVAAESSCSSCSHHAPVPINEPTDDEPTDDEPTPEKTPACGLCEILTTAIPLSPEWGGPSPVATADFVAVVDLGESIAPSLRAVSMRSRGPPIV